MSRQALKSELNCFINSSPVEAMERQANRQTDELQVAVEVFVGLSSKCTDENLHTRRSGGNTVVRWS